MITISPPHAALNDPRAPARAHMRYTYYVGRTESRQDIIDRIVHAASLTPHDRLNNVVISCHGNASYLQLGQGFTPGNASVFSAWRGKVRKIWLRACRVARSNASGHSLPAAIARAARCHVVASTELQAEFAGRVLPYGQLDTFEGLVLDFGPSGRITWQRRYPSTYQDPDDGWLRNPD
jgi:hypothetical protein